ncbi:FAD-dependent monooxygenase [Quadrisphaera sp. DSM 44207]|uniref:FAD-dependent monooxygenase n=1 Tax=Quadrisphaera sp. DSM 44207 TaxID=1881057 RepID=UPI00088F6C44|nr:FAD-dependent monooxygenase [Quadrisphaera sp. DSM 44207]SDQ07139.1 2-polyprenyl-6-methoxyphenol hydroxylase [Quadrisphaera sp. DSM 44207]
MPAPDVPTPDVPTPDVPTSACDVLVVGAGPTGVMAACWLARCGVDAVVVDGKAGPTRESRALALQARTLEVYDQLGVVDRVLERARVADAVAPGYERRSFGRVELGELGGGVTPYPRIHVLEQSENERLLVEHLQRLGGRVRWGHRLTALRDGDGGASGAGGTSGGASGEGPGVVAELQGPHGAVRVRARYCIGADGASSTVRSLRGIPFEGVTNAGTFFVADAAGVRGLVPGAVNARPGATSFLLTFPMGAGERHRLVGLVQDADGDGAVDEGDVRALLQRVYGVVWGPTTWSSTYRVHHRVAATFRDGPVLLAGDAAHVHSPVGAQGMNTGLQDAHGLALKLVDVLAGTASDASLDRYDAERRPVARHLVSTTDRAFGVITSQRPLARLVRTRVVPRVVPLAVRAVPRVRGASRVFEYVAQVRIHYWMSEEARTASGARRGRVVGRRLPWTGENHAVLRSATWQVHCYGPGDDAAARALAQRLGTPVHAFAPCPARGLDAGTALLVRPDGFVAAAAPLERAAEELPRALPDRHPARRAG